MSDEDRIQLMILVKEGKISVQEAVDTVHSPCIASLSCLACIFHTLTLTLNLTLTLTVLTPCLLTLLPHCCHMDTATKHPMTDRQL